MSLSVVYTTEGKETLWSIYDFVNSRFGIRSADDFALKAAKVISLIATQPYMYKASEIDEQVRVGFITKQCSLIYRVTETEIHLLYFWDNRQEPIL